MTYCGSWILVNSYPFSAARVINVIRRSGSSPHRNWQYYWRKYQKNQIEKKKKAFLEHHVTISVPNFVYLRRFWAIFRRPNIGSFSARGLFTATCYALCRVPSFVDQKNYYVHIVVLVPGVYVTRHIPRNDLFLFIRLKSKEKIPAISAREILQIREHLVVIVQYSES